MIAIQLIKLRLKYRKAKIITIRDFQDILTHLFVVRVLRSCLLEDSLHKPLHILEKVSQNIMPLIIN